MAGGGQREVEYVGLFLSRLTLISAATQSGLRWGLFGKPKMKILVAKGLRPLKVGGFSKQHQQIEQDILEKNSPFSLTQVLYRNLSKLEVFLPVTQNYDERDQV